MTRTCLLAAWLFCSVTAVLAEDASWKVGAARENITPGTWMWMAGYGGRDKPAEGKLTDLWAKALVLEDAQGRRGVVLTVDLVGIDRETSRTVCDAIAKQHSLERGQIAICTSHTHTGPVVGMNLGPLHYLVVDANQQQLIRDYTAELVNKLTQVVARAVEKLEPCELTWGSGEATFAVNRRNNREAEVPKLRTERALVGPFDHDVPVLAARRKSGQLAAVLFGYACHATVLSLNEWSGDYPGYAQLDLEAAYPDAVALFFAGCGADQNPLPRRTPSLAQHYGRRLATAVDAVLTTTAMRPVPPQLTTAYREIALPLDTLPARGEIEQDAQSTNKFVAARAKMLLAQLDAGKPLDQTYPYPIALWRLGDELQFISLGGEVVVDYSLRLKTELHGIRTWVAGYSHDVMAYIPSRRVWTEGGYEGGGAMVYYGLPTRWSPEVEEQIIAAAHELAR